MINAVKHNFQNTKHLKKKTDWITYIKDIILLSYAFLECSSLGSFECGGGVGGSYIAGRLQKQWFASGCFNGQRRTKRNQD